MLLKNIFFTILPSVGFVLIEAVPIFDDLCKALLVIIFSVFIINTIIKISLREEEHDREIEDELKKYEKYVISQKLLNSIMEIEKRKNDLLKNDILEYSCAMKSHFRKSRNQMSGKWKSSYASLLA